MLKNTTVQLMALGLVGSFAATATAQDSGALIDALVRKGVLKDQEAEQIRAQMTRDFAANSSAGKLNLNSSIKELKLSGDVRLRYQYDTQDNQTGTANVDQRSRYRLRLRVNADYKLSDDWFAGFGLQTTQNSDSGNQTMANGATGGDYFQNYNVYISKAFIGWNPINGVTLIGGKQVNPFYTTDLLWDADINPTGFTQRVDLHKVFGFSGLELSVVGGQLIVSDGTEKSASSTNANRDAWIYQTQVVAAAEVLEGFKVTLAPGYYCTNRGAVVGMGGGEANDIVGGNALSKLSVLLAPGDVSFKVAGKPAKVLWDVAYNLDGSKRTSLYQKAYLNTPANVTANAVGVVANATPFDSVADTLVSKSEDKLAFLVGFQVGENKKKGDWSVSANYRRVGMSSIDPNVNDSDWALSFTNMQGYKVGVQYNLGDSTTLGATYYIADNLRKELWSNDAGSAIYGVKPFVSPMNSVQVLQLDLQVKF